MALRQFPRYKFTENESCESKVILNNAENSVQTLDLSPTGLAFTGALQLKPGDTITIEVAPFGGSPMTCSAQIVRADAAKDGTLYGARFLSLPLLYQERLHKLIRSALFSKSIETYADTQSLKIKMPEAALIKRLLWVAFVICAIYAQMKIIGVLT